MRLTHLLAHIDTESDYYLIFRVFSQLLYYTQFGFNAIYGALVVYDKSTQPANEYRKYWVQLNSENMKFYDMTTVYSDSCFIL